MSIYNSSQHKKHHSQSQSVKNFVQEEERIVKRSSLPNSSERLGRIPESYFDEQINKNVNSPKPRVDSDSNSLVHKFAIRNKQRYEIEKKTLDTGDDVEPYITNILEFEGYKHADLNTPVFSSQQEQLSHR